MPVSGPAISKFGMPGGDTIAKWLPPAASVAGSIIDAATQRANNTANAKQAQKQMDFEERMSDTAITRQVQDYKNAGLNPANAYQQGGASSPAGTSAQMQPLTSNTGGKLNQALDTYNQLATAAAQRDLIRAQTEATTQQAYATEQDRFTKVPEWLVAQDETYRANLIASKRATTAQQVQQAQNYPEQFRTTMAEIAARSASLNQSVNTGKAQEQLLRTQSTLNEQDFTNEYFRTKIAPWVNSTARTIKPFMPVIRLGY